MKTVAIFCAAILICGCTATASKRFDSQSVAQVTRGQTTQEVRGILGNPGTTIVARDGSTFRYAETGKPVFAVRFDSDGKVTGCGYVSE